MKLVIGDKNYSSWSMRPWLLLTHFGIAFEEVLIELDQPGTKDAILSFSASGKVPCLVSDDGANLVSVKSLHEADREMSGASMRICLHTLRVNNLHRYVKFCLEG